MSTILSSAKLGFPFETESPFLFAVYHLDNFPAGNEEMGVDSHLLRGHRIGADFMNPAGWNMYHGEEGIPGFPKHPHRGFETLTIVRRGLVDHTDSLGNGGRFGYGDAQWMTAGSGVSHAEMFPLLNRSGPNVLELFQCCFGAPPCYKIWINLPKASKMATPCYKMLWAEDIPKRVVGTTGAASGPSAAVEVTVVAGALPGFDAPPEPPPNSYAQSATAEMLVVTVKLAAGASWTLPATASGGGPGLHRNVYFYSGGAVSIAGKVFTSQVKVKVRPEVDVEIRAEAGGVAEVLILQGREIGEPVVQHGPFVGNTREDITKAFQDYQSTGFGRWPWEGDALAFPRERPRFAKFADGSLVEKPLP